MRSPAETHLHFVGIGGIGMSGIAEVFLNQGYRITGSDAAESESTRRLARLGASIAIGHEAAQMHGAKVVVISSAIRADNPEVQEAHRLRVPVIPRAEMLGELMRGKTGIAIAGTHGKTTTTSMMATVLTYAQLDPTLVIGGRVDLLGGNAKLGQGKYVVAEADESDGSFLHLPATIGVITNIDNDHLDHFGSLTEIEESFGSFVAKLPFYGLAAVCGEDSGVRRCLARWTKPLVTYGLSAEWDFYAKNIEAHGLKSTFDVYARESRDGAHKLLGQVKLGVPGVHNVLNSLAVIAVAMNLDLDFATIAAGLAAFRGVKRRFDIRWQDAVKRRVLVDDYGHHPTEIVATLAAARAFWPEGRIVTVFQPHRYSRTLHCKDGFLSAFGQSNVVILTDIYAAGEDPIEGVDSKALAEDLKRVSALQQEVVYAGDLSSAQEELCQRVTDGDLVLCLGAGSITKLADQLVTRFEKSASPA